MGDGQDVAAQLQKLKELHRLGALDDDEFVAANSRLLQGAAESSHVANIGVGGPEQAASSWQAGFDRSALRLPGQGRRLALPAILQDTLPVLLSIFALYSLGELLSMSLPRALSFCIVTGLVLIVMVTINSMTRR
jgi:hypothetical protein